MNILTAGARLKKIRLEKGLALEDIQKKTRIHLNILKAIEGDSISDLSPIYLKGFLKIYAKFLGVDPKEYITDYKETGYSAPVVPQKEPTPTLAKHSKLNLSSFRITRQIKQAILLIIVVLFVAMGIFKLGKFISYKFKQSPAQVKSLVAKSYLPVAKNKKNPKKQAVIVKAPKVDLKEKETALTKKEVFSGIRLTIRANQSCWISLKTDGKVAFQRTLEKGRSVTWQAKDKIEFSVGNAGAVELEVNEQHFANLGRNGQALKNIVITKEGLKIP